MMNSNIFTHNATSFGKQGTLLKSFLTSGTVPSASRPNRIFITTKKSRCTTRKMDRLICAILARKVLLRTARAPIPAAVIRQVTLRPNLPPVDHKTCSDFSPNLQQDLRDFTIRKTGRSICDILLPVLRHHHHHHLHLRLYLLLGIYISRRMALWICDILPLTPLSLRSMLALLPDQVRCI